MKYALWVVQALLGVQNMLFGFMKLSQPYEAQTAMMAWVSAVPEPVIRFIGAAELLGGLGLILPAATRVMPGLTPLAALGIVVLQALAAGFHVLRGEWSYLPVNLVIALLAAFVAYGRWKLVPIRPRGETTMARPAAA